MEGQVAEEYIFDKITPNLIDIAKRFSYSNADLDDAQFKDCYDDLKTLYTSFKSAQNRQSLPAECITSQLSVLDVCAIFMRDEHHKTNHDVTKDSACVMALVQCMTNLTAASSAVPRNQDEVCSQSREFETVHSIMSCELKKAEEENLNPSVDILRSAVKLLLAACAGHKENQIVVWRKFRPMFRRLLMLSNCCVHDITCELIHMCLLENADLRHQRTQFLLSPPEGIQIAAAILNRLVTHDSQYGFRIVTRLLAHPVSISDVYRCLNQDERLFLMDVIIFLLDKFESQPCEENSDNKPVSVATMKFLTDEFKTKSHSIPGLVKDDMEVCSEPVIVSKQLEVLCVATSIHNLYPSILQDEGLVKCVIELLRCLHTIGREGKNDFSPVNKLSDGENIHPTKPTYGLKRNLVRLLANLAYRNKSIQDKIREEGGIQLLLNHTDIDSKNPFMMQWSIFAIRNLCENNTENQQLIAGLSLKDVSVSHMQALREFGVKANIREGKVVVNKVDR